MNRNELRKNIGQVFKFFPIPRRDSTIGSYESENNQWLLRRETPDKKSFEFLNMIGDYNPLVLDPLKIKNFDAPDILILRGQVILEGSTVRYEPSHPKPASTIAVNLRMSIEGADENNLLLITSPPLEPVRFAVENMGEQTVRDYRNTVLIPTDFSRSSSASYIGNLSQSGNVEIAKHQYSVYGNFISEPIYKKESVCIGSLLLKANYGEYNLLWQIRCDDGVFPSETTYGEIKIRVVPLGSLVERVAENLYEEP